MGHNHIRTSLRPLVLDETHPFSPHCAQLACTLVPCWRLKKARSKAHASRLYNSAECILQDAEVSVSQIQQQPSKNTYPFRHYKLAYSIKMCRLGLCSGGVEDYRLGPNANSAIHSVRPSEEVWSKRNMCMQEHCFGLAPFQSLNPFSQT